MACMFHTALVLQPCLFLKRGLMCTSSPGFPVYGDVSRASLGFEVLFHLQSTKIAVLSETILYQETQH